MEPLRICQVELRTRDLDGAIAFWTAAFDWTITRTSNEYAIIDTGAAPVGSILQTPDEDWPLGVCHYVLVGDARAYTDRAVALGAHVAVDLGEVEDAGRFAITLDPSGVEWGLWEPSGPYAPRFEGTGRNRFCWVEAPVHDLDGAVDYHAALFGWTFGAIDEAPEYAAVDLGEGQMGVGLVAGERAARMAGMTTYVATDDIDASFARIEAAGGRILVAPKTLGSGSGTLGLFADPEGQVWGLVMEGAAEPSGG